MTALSVPLIHRAVRRDWLLTIFGAVGGLLVLAALFGRFVAPYTPDQTDILAAGQGSSPQHLLGTDSLGRDILSRLLAGARLSFAGPAVIVLVSSVLGTAIAISRRGTVVGSTGRSRGC